MTPASTLLGKCGRWTLSSTLRPASTPSPICMVARELRTGRTLKFWGDELLAQRIPRIRWGRRPSWSPTTLPLSEAATWPWVGRCLRVSLIFRRFRCRTSGLTCRAARFARRDDILRSGWNRERREGNHAETGNARRSVHGRRMMALLDYCESDVIGPVETAAGHAADRSTFRERLARPLHGGRREDRMKWHPYRRGHPEALRSNWTAIQDRLIGAIDRHYGIYEGRIFKVDRFAAWLAAKGIQWPGLGSALWTSTDDTFTKWHVAILKLLRSANSATHCRNFDCPNWPWDRTDGIVAYCRPFQARTGRNQPSSSRFIFGPSVWLRGLIRPQPGHAVAYLDYEQQEFGIAAALQATRPCKRPTPLATLPGVRQAGWGGPIQCDEGKPQATAGPVQGLCARCSVWHGAAIARRTDWPAGIPGPRTATASSTDLPSLLEVVGCGGQPRYAARLAAHGVRLAGPCRPGGQSTKPGELPYAGQRGGNASVGLLSGDGTRDSGLRAVHDALLIEATARRHRPCRGRDGKHHGRSQPDRA